MLYKAQGTLKYKRGTEESQPGDLSDALVASGEMLRSKRFKVITILRDSEGYDHPSNAGKWFLDRIVK